MFTRISTRYGNWIATTRVPQFPWTRRLARQNPTDVGKLMLYLSACQVIVALGKAVNARSAVKRTTP